jgi:hypothetical protein
MDEGDLQSLWLLLDLLSRAVGEVFSWVPAYEQPDEVAMGVK